jgi:chemotaxis signal transduction protein
LTAGLAPIGTRAAALRRDFDLSFARASTCDATGRIDLIAIRLADDAYAIRLADVVGLSADKRVTALPGPVRSLLGVAGFRGAVVPVHDLRALLGYADRALPRWMVLAAGGAPVGLAFDRFEGLLRVSPDAFAEQPGACAPHVRTIVQTGACARQVLDVRSIVASITETVRSAGPRKDD